MPDKRKALFAIKAADLSSRILVKDRFFKPGVENALRFFCKMKQGTSVGWLKNKCTQSEYRICSCTND